MTDINAFIAKNDHIPYFNFPVFRSYLAQQNQRAEIETNEMKKIILRQEVVAVATKIKAFYECWPGIAPDYFKTYFNLLTQPYNFEKHEKDSIFNGIGNPKVASWFREHCSGERFLRMIFQHSKKSGKNLVDQIKDPGFLEIKYAEDANYKQTQTETDPNVLHELALKGDYGILYQVAKNPNTSSDTLRMFVEDYNIDYMLTDFILKALALNPNTPNDVKTYVYTQIGFDATNRTLNDTLKQLEEMRNKDLEVPPFITDDNGNVKKLRWRLDEFHDHISHLYLCQSVENTPFKNVTIKQPYTEGNWSLYSPKDTLELALWAHRVNNCVLQRESRVHSGHSEIVCVEENGEPRYTVEINGPESRKREGLDVKEIQKKGIQSGMTVDHNKFVYNMIQRALKAAE